MAADSAAARAATPHNAPLGAVASPKKIT